MNTSTRRKGVLRDVRLEDLYVDQDFNCRKHITPSDVALLARQIQEQGLLNPINVIRYKEDEAPINPDSGMPYSHRLIAGFRRFTAHKILGMDVIRCHEMPEMENEVDYMIINLNENLQRSDLTILEEAQAIANLVKKCPKITRDEICNKLARKTGWVQTRLYLLKLPSRVQELVEGKFVSTSQIRELYTTLIRSGEEPCIEQAYDLKKQKQAGNVRTNIKMRLDPKTKASRTKKEIFAMMDHIRDQNNGNNNLATAALAWSAGEVSTEEFHIEAAKYFSRAGVCYSTK